MSFARIIYKILLPTKITVTFADIPKVLDIIKDITDGKIVDDVEKHEFKKFQALADNIDAKVDLQPMLRELLNDRTKGKDIQEALLQHRTLIHALFYNKAHVMNQMSKIIDELEVQVRIQENARKVGYKVIEAPGQVK